MLDGQADRGRVRAPDGTRIAWWRYRPAAEAPPGGRESARLGDRGTPARPILLVHGTTADHTTFRVIGPRLAGSRPTIALDRRGREASGDTLPYSLEREFEDVAAVADALAESARGQVDVLGHSYGGRCAIGAALLTPSIRRVVSYEGAVPPGVGTSDPRLVARLRRLQTEGRGEELLHAFLTEVVEMTPDEWEAFRTSAVWPARLAAAHTVVRELEAGATADAAWERSATLRIPVLQLLGSESAPMFAAGARALAARLHDGRLAVIEGARHAAHHTHPDRLLDLVLGFLDEPTLA
jgi:pimeloyl-ACP methyl ester carboxylesterase